MGELPASGNADRLCQNGRPADHPFKPLDRGYLSTVFVHYMSFLRVGRHRQEDSGRRARGRACSAFAGKPNVRNIGSHRSIPGRQSVSGSIVRVVWPPANARTFSREVSAASGLPAGRLSVVDFVPRLQRKTVTSLGLDGPGAKQMHNLVRGLVVLIAACCSSSAQSQFADFHGKVDPTYTGPTFKRSRLIRPDAAGRRQPVAGHRLPDQSAGLPLYGAANVLAGNVEVDWVQDNAAPSVSCALGITTLMAAISSAG